MKRVLIAATSAFTATALSIAPITAQTVPRRPSVSSVNGLSVRYVRADSVKQADRILGAQGIGAFRTTTTRLGQAAVSLQHGPCELTPHDVHLRDSFKGGAEGVKPTTTCTRPVKSIKHATELHFLWDMVAPQAGPTFIERSGKKRAYMTLFQSTEVAVHCDSRDETLWFGTTVGTIVYQGRTYHARVYHRPKPLSCGTNWP